MASKPSITFCTGVGTVTGANFLLETAAGTNILIDCGMVQGEKVALEQNSEAFPYDLSSISALVITHAHLDHVGRIPKLVHDGYRGPIYSTPQTRELAELVLNDAVGILAMEARQEKREPLYGMAEVEAIWAQWKTVEYHEQLKLSDDVSIFLKDAGHILGSAMIEVTVRAGEVADSDAGNSSRKEFPSARVADARNASSLATSPALTKILFTGDLGNSPAPLLCDTEPVGDVDYIVMESVYGDRNHEDRQDRTAKLERVIKETIARGGTLVIPTFSIDRTQVLLYELNNMVERKLIPSIPVFVDSPMAIRSTDVYRENTELFNDHVREQIRNGDDIFKFPHLEYTMSKEEAVVIDHTRPPRIILAGSGMSVGGRIITHEADALSDPKSTVLLVGYQAPGSLGRRLADGEKKVTIHGQEIRVAAHIETLYGYSAHKDGDHLVEFVSTATKRLKEAFVVMGEPGASMHLAQRLNDELDANAVVPERNKKYEI